MTDSIRTPEVEHLLEILAKLQSADELYRFLLDACTPRELIEIAQRLEVARLLHDGIAYSLIQQRTGASATTIARVSKCLQYGDGGYEMALALRETDLPDSMADSVGSANTSTGTATAARTETA